MMGNSTTLLCRHSSIHHTHITEEIKKTIQVRELEIAEAIATSDIKIAEVENKLQDMSIANPARPGDEAVEKDGVIEQIREERAALTGSSELLEGLLANTKQRTGISITNVHMSKGGKVISGLVNTQGKYVDARVTIDNVVAATGGTGIAGIVEGVNLGKFFN